MKPSNSHLILFWSVPSISMVKEYKAKTEQLKSAILNLNPIEIITTKNEVLKLEKVEIESGSFFGLNTIKGNIRKIFLNINHIKAITLL